ncbi:MAG: hypothetical protein Q8O75_02710 [bacterium]|nr:hypothetical protein [bacterium]
MPDENVASPQTNPPPAPPGSQTSSGINWKNIIIGVVIGAVLFGGGGYLVYNAYQPKEEPAQNATTTTKTSTPSSTTKKEEPKDETADWVLLSNTQLGYSVKYPPTWKTKRCTENVPENKSTDGFGPNEANTGTCASGSFPTIFIASGKNYLNIVDSSYTDYKTENLTIAGRAAIKTSGVTKGRPDIQDGIYIVEYTFVDKSLYIKFTGNKTDTDNLNVLDQMLSTFKFLD